MASKQSITISNLLDRLTTQIGIIKSKIESENSLNNQGLNLLLENLVIQIMNLTYDLNLVNTNKVTNNYPGVDAIDPINKIAVQITSTSTKAKVIKTIKTFKKAEESPDYELKFFFLRNKPRFIERSEQEIEELISNDFKFDYSEGVLDLNSIMQELYFSGQYEKVQEVVEILDKVVGDSSLELAERTSIIGICFSGDTGDAYMLTEALLNFGYSVLIEDRKLYQEFNDHRQKDSLLLLEEVVSVESIKHFIIVLNTSFIGQNLSDIDPKSRLFEYALSRNSRIEIVAFDQKIRFERIKNEAFLHWQIIPRENNLPIIEGLLEELLSEKVAIEYEIDIVSKNLEELFPSDEVRVVEETSFYSLIEFILETPPSKFYFLVFDHDYKLNDAHKQFEKTGRRWVNDSFAILIPRDPYQRTDKRLDTVKSTFNTDSVSFVDDFFYKRSFKITQEEIAIKDNFIEPLFIQNGQNKVNLSGVIGWIINSGSKIGLLKGGGGVGKTMTCEIIYNRLIPTQNNYSRFYVIFIDALELVEQFKRIDFSYSSEYELYNFYREWYDLQPRTEPIIEKSSFDFNFNLGNILLIFDGIDEIISTVPTFTLKSFLKNVLKLKGSIGRGKILIVCRDQYVDDIDDFLNSNEDKLSTFQLLPFNQELAEQYFESYFPEDEKRVKNSLNALSNSILPSENSEYVYPPFILQVVKQQVEREIELDLTFESQLLDQKDKNDYIIYRICSRECSKKDIHGFELSVDGQIKFFMYLAIEEDILQIKDLSAHLMNIGFKDSVEDVANGIFDHPLLLKKDNSLVFRYDFLRDYLKAMAILKTLGSDKAPSKRMIKVLATEFEIKSLVVKYLIPKLSKDSDHQTKAFSSLIFRILMRQDIDYLTEKAISNLIIMRLFLNGNSNLHHEKQVKLNTETLKSLVNNEHGIINYLYLIDIPSNFNIVFNFSNLLFSKAKIINYKGFLDCKFSRNTFFDEQCEISRITPKSIDPSKIQARNINFDSRIQGDNSLYKILKLVEPGEFDNIKKMNLKIIKDQLKLFKLDRGYSGRLSWRILESNLSNSNNSKELLRVQSELIKTKIIVKKGNYLMVHDNLQKQVARYIEEGTVFQELNEVVSKLLMQPPE